MIKLHEIDTRAPDNFDKKETREKTEQIARQIGELQTTLQAENKHSLLVILQGMDASGKDGSLKATFPYCNPIGIKAHAFKKPTEEERNHDFLWRVHQHAPAKGMIQIFNRSHYEDILIQRVHKWIDEKQVYARMSSINAFEQLLQYDNNTTILKFYLHISQEEQLDELQERIDETEKNWKHKEADWKEAVRWDDYRTAYEYAINESTVPWVIIPADQAWYRNYMVAKNVRDTLESMNMNRPEIAESERENLKEKYS